MEYTFKISDHTQQSKSIIDMLLSLSKDSDFLEVIEQNSNTLSPLQEAELDARYENFVKNPQNGKPWHEVKKNLLQL